MEKAKFLTHTRDHKECVHMQILNLVALLAGNFLEQSHGLSANYSNFPWHTCIFS